MDNTDISLVILRLAVGLTFAAHGAQKVLGWWGGSGIAKWQGAIASMGFRPAALFAQLSAWTELGGGLLIAAGLLTPFVAALLVAQSVVIIVKVHWAKGFFISKGGIEFAFVLAAGVVAIGLLGPGALSLDDLVGLAVEPTLRGLLIVAGLAAGVVALLDARLGSGGTAPVPPAKT